ncbi:hypothetical protein [Clostridium cellulovorans]|uniref:Uncharacterized protein n=1 Tax=Clostridium cellulovorans (strain ATCC 35296 / DSM 3052 / OCM 3 / 743B) TaxID=573061 RepID=D9SQN1_CLOC7|nr:hypothetical protein Clocel_2525 [Clostridium cellulovorans 743B]
MKLYEKFQLVKLIHKIKKDRMKEEKNFNRFSMEVIDKPARKMILRRGKDATEYFWYCKEVGYDNWRILVSIKEAVSEPMGMWLPENLRTPGTSVYVQGVEVPLNYEGEIPEGFEIIKLKPCKMMVFKSQPYEDEKFMDMIQEMWGFLKNYNPEIYGFKWAEEDGPRFQFAPMGYRGYIEGRPVRAIR